MSYEVTREMGPNYAMGSKRGSGSKIECIWSLAACFQKLNTCFGRNVAWPDPISAAIGAPVLKDLMERGEIEAFAAENAEAINAFLSDHGFAVRLQPFESSLGIYRVATAAALHLQESWDGADALVQSEQNVYSAFTIRASNDNAGVKALSDAGTTFRFWWDGMPALVKPTCAIELTVPVIACKYMHPTSALLGRTVDLDGPIRTLSGNLFEGDGILIEQVVQQSCIDLTRHGVEFDSGAAVQVAVTGCLPRMLAPQVVIDKPFNLDIVRDGVLIASCFLDHDSWLMAEGA